MRASLVLFILALVVLNVNGLSDGEIHAIERLLDNLPSLGTVQPPWTINATAACDSPPFYGLTCSKGPDPHVTGLKFHNINIIGDMPTEIGGLLWLESIELLDSSIGAAIPDSMGLLKNLTRIVIQEAGGMFNVKSTPFHAIFTLPKLEEIDLSANLAGVFPSVTDLPVLRLLSLRCLGLPLDQQVPTGFWWFDALENLTLQSCGLYDAIGLPSFPAPFPRLKYLSLAESPFIGVDVIVWTSRELEWIDIWSAFPLDGAIGLSKLRHLHAGVLTPFREEFWPSVPNLEYCQLTGATGIIHASIGSLKNLTHLSLQGKLSGTIPEEITNCPLEELYLGQSQLSHPLPDTFGRLNNTLRVLDLSSLRGEGTIPRSVGKLSQVWSITMPNAGLVGTIPDLLGLPKLIAIFLDNNRLTGSLPELSPASSPTQWIQIRAPNNLLTGTIPRSLARRSFYLHLAHNLLGPSVEKDLFDDTNINVLNLSFNRFSGPLPDFSVSGSSIYFNSNAFNGTVPIGYRHSSYVQLSQNHLSGPLEGLFSPPNAPLSIYINFNDFSGPFPSIGSSVTTMDISHNDFDGPLPVLPKGLTRFYASNTKFSTQEIEIFVDSCRRAKLSLLDLSNIGLDPPVRLGISVFDFVGSDIEYLYLANNRFTFTKMDHAIPNLRALDLTNNSLSGEFPFGEYSNLAVFKIANNSFTRVESLPLLTSIVELDFSENLLRLDAGQLTNMPSLTILHVQGNQLFGEIDISSLPSLTTADFSRNELDRALNLNAIGQQFVNGPLRLFNVSKNPLLPKLRFDTNHTGLARSRTATPSDSPLLPLLCYQLEFHGASGRVFVFDEDLFNYDECDCDHDHFGAPPNNCVPCPSSGMKSCGGPEATVEDYSFAYITHSANNGSRFNASVERDVSTFETLFSGWSSITHDSNTVALKNSSSGSNVTIELHTESCLITALQRLSGRSNCIGVQLTSENMSSPNVSIDHVLATQCMTGSEGRLCSKCICGADGDDCWFIRGPQCSHCKHALKLPVSLPIAFVLLIVLIAVLSVVFGVLMYKKRTQKLERWSRLPLWKRIFYRTQLLTSLGNVSILVTFVQMLVSFTQWDAYAKTGLLGIVNGDGSRLGLGCIFPFLNHPMWALISQLSVPFVGVLVVAISTAIGSVLAKFLEARRKNKIGNATAASDEGSLLISASESEEIALEYPAMALLTSFSITIVKFFYLGTALASHQYLFPVTQQVTGIKYSQHSPWMRYSEALPLILASIPSILIFDFGLPIAFMVLCWKVRKRFGEPSVQIYFGSLFDTYNPRCFWWEIVNILKKLTVALILRSIPDGNAVQSALIVTILLGTQAIQTSMNPWRRKTENIADGISTAILCGALLSTRPSQLLEAANVIWYMLALSILFVLGSIAVIAWHAVTGTTSYQTQTTTFWSQNSSRNGIQERMTASEARESILESEPVVTTDSEE